RRWVRPRRPVVVTGITAGWLPPRQWTLERMATVYGDARVIAAALADGTLLDDPATGVVFRRVQLGRFIESIASAGAAADYVMAPVSNFGPALEGDYRVPVYCAGAAHL